MRLIGMSKCTCNMTPQMRSSKKKMLATIRHNEFKITLDVPDVL